MRHFFIDTNVLIDYLSGREPFVDDAAELFNLAFTGQVVLYAASISFSNCYYIITKQYRGLNGRALLADMLPLVDGNRRFSSYYKTRTGLRLC